MNRRYVHYEAAFEDYLRSRGAPYVPVDESRRAVFAGAKIKSFDFLVYRPGGATWLVDVKGRKFPYDTRGGKHYWENWVTRDDLDGLAHWQRVFGEGFESVLVFAYWLTCPADPPPSRCLHTFRGLDYAFLAIPIDDYQAHARPRSESWQTLSIPAAHLRRLATPFAAA